MELLHLLTLIYAAVLVVALAASLIAILVYLRRIDSALEHARAGLERAGTATQPLSSGLRHLDREVEAAHAHLERAAGLLGEAEREISGAAERRGMGAAARQGV